MVVLVSFLLPVAAQAQLAVADAPVLAAVGSAVTALKSILDETRRSLESLANWGAIVQQMQAVAQLVSEVEALTQEIDQLDAGWGQLADSGAVLCSLDEAVRWKGHALGWQQRGFQVARSAHRLLGRTTSMLLALQSVLAGITGATSGAQSTSAALTLVATELHQLQGLTASFQSGIMGRDLIESIIGIQLVCIHQGHMAGWGSYSR